MSVHKANLVSLDVSTADHPDFEANRNFWLRFHHSHLAQYTMRAPPLMATSLDRCFRSLSDTQVEQGFLLYDIMHRLHPGLASQLYDVPEKMPTKDQIAELGPLFDGVITPGEVFAAKEPFDERSTPEERDSPVALLVREYEKARPNQLREGLSRSVSLEADQTIREIDQTEKLPNRIAFQPVHAVLLSALIATSRIPLTTRMMELSKLTLKWLKDKLR